MLKNNFTRLVLIMFILYSVFKGICYAQFRNDITSIAIDDFQIPEVEKINLKTTTDDSLFLQTNKKGMQFSAIIYKNPKMPIAERVEDLLSRMTLEEKIGQLNSPVPTQMVKDRDTDSMVEACRKFVGGTLVPNVGPAGGIWATSRITSEDAKAHAELNNELQKIAMEKTRLKIPLFFFEEGTHGFMAPKGTVYPEGLAIGSTWNTKLVEQVYSVAAKEGRSRGVHFLGTLVVEPNRDPRLGRNEEGYSEDPYLCSQITQAIVKGVQGKDISANDKAIALLCHFPGQSEPLSGLERGAMEITERNLSEIFLPPWFAGNKKSGPLGEMAGCRGSEPRRQGPQSRRCRH